MILLTPQQIEEFKASHGRIAHVRGSDGAWEVVYRKPTRAEYKRYRAMCNDPVQKPEAMEVLARSVVVHPSKEDFDKLLDDYTMVADVCADRIGALAGLGVDESAK